MPNADDVRERGVRRRVIGFFMFPVALFPLLALLSYDWHAIPCLCVPPAPSSNLIGVAGDRFAFWGYQFAGLGVWFVPLVCLFAGLRLVAGRTFHPGRRTAGVSLFILSATCLLQLAGLSPALHGLMRTLNIAPNAGGAVGHLIMTRGLARLLSPFGSGVLMAALALFAVLLTIGLRNIIGVFARLTAWAADRDPSDGADPAAIEAVRAAREKALAERLAEKQRIAAEKAAAKAEKEAAKEERRRAREAERAAKEAERRAKEEARNRVTSGDYLPAREDVGIGRTEGSAVRLASEPPVPPAAVRRAPATPAPAAPAPVEAAVVEPPKADKGPYVLPPVSLLNEAPAHGEADASAAKMMAQRLIDTLKVFDVNAQLAFYVAGPVVTQYALTLDVGTRVEKFASLSRNLQMALQATSLRIEAPIPGKNAVGIEVPNAKPASVSFREIIDGDLWQRNAPGKFQLPLLLGKDAAGNDLVADLAKLPHLLVAGATGQGKSVCLNSIINGLLMCRTPEQVKMIMVDPKRVEFTSYKSLPHLLVPVINDTKKVMFGLRWAVVEMDRRLKLFARAGCRNIVDFNTRKVVTQPDMLGGEETAVGGGADMPRTIPYIVIVIDEVADIMQAAQKDVEPLIARLTALARAAGIHLILATQRPDAKIITGVIKSNIPGRIAFKTSSSIDSRTILDATGSEQLIGKGDMLFKMSDGRLLRAQGSFISDEEINRIVDFIGEHADPQFDEALRARLDKIKEADPADALADDEEDAESSSGGASDGGEPLAAATANGIPAPAGMTQSKEDQLYRRALEVLRDTRRASTSHLQRRMGIGYNHAARLIDLLEERGVIGTARGAGPREILLDPATLLNDGAAEPESDTADGSVPVHPDIAADALPPDDDSPFGTTL